MLGRQASNNQFARYFYYIGRIKTIQLEYTEALNYLQEALRKAPQSGVVGFRITVNKCIAIVQLLKVPPLPPTLPSGRFSAVSPAEKDRFEAGKS